MAWLAVDKDKKEAIHQNKPIKEKGCFDDTEFWWSGNGRVNLPSGSIEKLIGRKLTWEDEPVEIT